MPDLIFCEICDKDVSHDGAYVIATQAGHASTTHHRDCFVDCMSDCARNGDEPEVTVKFVAGPNFNPDA
mgnify:CR=1 FL=1